MYLKPLRTRLAEGSPIISAEDMRVIFSDVEIILSANMKLLNDLDKKMAQWHPTQTIGDVFLEMVRNMYQLSSIFPSIYVHFLTLSLVPLITLLNLESDIASIYLVCE